MHPLQDLLDPSAVVQRLASFDASSTYEWLFECHGFWHNALLVASSLSFALYLGFQARRSFSKLVDDGRSNIMIAYYGCLWIVSLSNLAWCSLQSWECSPGKEVAWNILSLFTTSGMLFLEVSLVAFLLHGNSVSGSQALTRTFVVSGLIIALDLLLKALYLFRLGIPLFIDNSDDPHPVKWNLWVVHMLALTGVYAVIMVMYHSRWKERLPARPAYYRYIIIMLVMNALVLLACALTGTGARFGMWLYGASIVSYHAFYLPLLYFTFLADFFKEDDLHLDNAYYSEMKDPGFLDGEWE